MSVQTVCAHCRAKIKAPAALIGQIRTCPKCKRAFEIKDVQAGERTEPSDVANVAREASRPIQIGNTRHVTPVDAQGPKAPNGVRRYAFLAAGSIIVVLVLISAFAKWFERRPDTTPSTSREQENLKYEDDVKYIGARLERLDNLPFEYDVVEVDVSMHPPFGPDVNVDLETTNEVAKEVTQGDLRRFWNRVAPVVILPDRHLSRNQRVGVKLYTPVPGAAPWAVITRFKDHGEYKVEISINEYGIDAEPYHFVNEIDRSLPNQGYMIVTLPVVNRILEELIRRGWKLKSRQEDFVCVEMNKGVGSYSVTLDPEGIDIDAYHPTGSDFQDTVQIVFGELGLADQVKRKLHSAIGSPEYMRVAPGKRASWTWKLGQIRVTYHRLPNWDQLSAEYAQQD